MAIPPKAACELIAGKMTLKSAALDALGAIKSARDKVIEVAVKLGLGIFDSFDAIGADALSAVAAASSSIVESLGSAVSKASSAVLELVIGEILKIIMAFPGSIYALVTISIEEAQRLVIEERKKLQDASSNMATITAIIIKWTSGISSVKYYNQMIGALPLIQAAEKAAQKIELDLTPSDGYNNQFFDESKYNELQRNLTAAIAITKPQSVIDSTFKISSTMDSKKNDYIAIESEKVNAKYDAKMRALTKEYQLRPASTIAKDAEVSYLYSVSRSALDAARKEELAAVIAKSTAASIPSINEITQSGLDTAASFVADMEIVVKSLRDYALNIGKAYRAYISYQAICGSIVSFRSLISTLINDTIAAIRSSKTPGDAVLNAIESANALLTMVDRRFQSAIDKYGSQGISASSMATTIVQGNTLLISADTVLHSTITDSLIKMVNADEFLKSEDDRFNNFIATMNRIPDWDGSLSKWCVDPDPLTPYIQLVADASKAVSDIPALAFSTSKDSHDKANKSIMSLSDTTNKLRRHNHLVDAALASYRPTSGPVSSELKRLLASINMLGQFAQYASIAQLAVAMSDSSLFNTSIPNAENCNRAYPELFSDAKQVASAQMEAMNRPSPTTNMIALNTMESKSFDNAYLGRQIANTNIQAGQDELENNQLPQNA